MFSTFNIVLQEIATAGTNCNHKPIPFKNILKGNFFLTHILK